MITIKNTLTQYQNLTNTIINDCITYNRKIAFLARNLTISQDILMPIDDITEDEIKQGTKSTTYWNRTKE